MYSRGPISMYSRGQISRSMYSRRQISRSTYSSGQIKISRSLCSSYRGVVCDAPSTTCSRLACIVCALRSGWGKTSLWFANFSTLIILKCKRRGNRARSKSRLGSISPLNSRRKTVSVLESLLKSVSSLYEKQQKNRVDTEIEYSIV